MWGIKRPIFGGSNKPWKDGKSALQLREEEFAMQQEKWNHTHLRLAKTVLADGTTIEYKKLEEDGTSTDIWIAQPTQWDIIERVEHHKAPDVIQNAWSDIAHTLKWEEHNDTLSIEVTALPSNASDSTPGMNTLIPTISQMTLATLFALDEQQQRIKALAEQFKTLTDGKTIPALITQPHLLKEVLKEEKAKEVFDLLVKELESYNVNRTYYGWLKEPDLNDYGKALTRMKNFARTTIALQMDGLLEIIKDLQSIEN